MNRNDLGKSLVEKRFFRGALLIGACGFLIAGLAGCTTPQNPDQKAYQNPSKLKNANLFEKLDGSQSYANFNNEPPAAPQSPVTEANGLVVQDIEKGWGQAPSKDRNVLVHYTGYLEGGVKFDSSRDKGMPFQFKIGSGKVIPGFEQGIMGMKVGGKRKLIIPANLAYGAEGHPPLVPPNATLTYEVQLCSSDQ